jgi:hypothetical protein
MVRKPSTDNRKKKNGRTGKAQEKRKKEKGFAM